MDGLATVLRAQAEVHKAVCLWGAAFALRESLGGQQPSKERERSEQQIGQARSVLGEEAFATAWAEGRALTSEQAVSYALEETTDREIRR